MNLLNEISVRLNTDRKVGNCQRASRPVSALSSDRNLNLFQQAEHGPKFDSPILHLSMVIDALGRARAHDLNAKLTEDAVGRNRSSYPVTTQGITAEVRINFLVSNPGSF